MRSHMKITQHANIRSQQRGIPKHRIEMILKYGYREKKPDGAYEVKVSQKQLKMLESELKRTLQDLDKIKKEAVLVSADNSIITVYNKL